MARLIERVGEDAYRFNANYKRIWQKLLEYEEIGTVEEFKELKQEQIIRKQVLQNDKYRTN